MCRKNAQTKIFKRLHVQNCRGQGFGFVGQKCNHGAATQDLSDGEAMLRIDGSVRKEGETIRKIEKSILVVDDDKSILRALTRILQKAGYSVETAETGNEAMGKTRKHRYDLALVDVRLPDMNGTDLLTTMADRLRETVKIVFTGFPSLETGVKALDVGADAYLVKPVKPEELLMLIEEKLRTS